MVFTVIAAVIVSWSVLLTACQAGGESSSHDTTSDRRTVSESVTPMTPVPEFATLITGGRAFSHADDAEPLVGFPLLRPDERVIGVVSQKGLTETFPEVGLPRARQTFVLKANDWTLHMTQEPISYPSGSARTDGDVSQIQVGRLDVQLEVFAHDVCMTFVSGAVLQKIPIRVLVCGSPEGFSVDDLREFVESLSFGGRRSPLAEQP
ncbi:MAG TPA: hypothetical protein VFH62_02095 [Dehalococcoidia bacterium]|jgi:hypothetical protein|nr:hypothetical protein [Dehalococcoidia bacterium]